MKVAVVGATGLVGSMMIRILEERRFPVTEFIPVATEKSVGQMATYMGHAYAVVSAEAAIAARPDIALFSAGGAASLALAPRFAAVGCTVIDNSSAWRMNPDVKLVVPEINGCLLTVGDRIIANPNCSTIQMVMVLAPLHRRYGIKRVVVSTYQSVSGTGKKGIDELEAQRNGGQGDGVYPHPIHNNVLPHIDVFLPDGYTKEEQKMVKETCKIIGDETIKVSATAVRVPVMACHSESVNIEFYKPFELPEVRTLLATMPGVTVVDDPGTNDYPLAVDAAGRDEVFVGRIRRDDTQANTLNCWIVSDNIRKGAATNAVQIAEIVAGLRK